MTVKRNSPEHWPKRHEPGIYRIRVVGRLGPEWGERLDGIELASTRQADGTVTTDLTAQLADQAALVGLVEQLAAVGASLLQLELMGPVSSAHGAAARHDRATETTLPGSPPSKVRRSRHGGGRGPKGERK